MTTPPILRRFAEEFVRRRRCVRFAIGLAILLFSRWWCSTGIDWSVGFHPDEFPVARWIDQVRDEGYITERPYPGGWFELARVGMWIEKRADMADAARARHRSQEGRVHALSAGSFAKRPAPQYEKPTHGLEWGRLFNVELYALTALLLYAAALEAGLGTLGSVVSAAFFLFAPSPLEHAHYCETDMGVLFSMALTFWLCARAVRLKSFAFALMASFAAGFCVSCKYTVAPLLFCPPALSAALGARGRRPARAVVFALAALFVAVCGFLVGTPVLFHDLPMAMEELRSNPHFEADPVVKFGALFREIARLGPFTIAWFAFSSSFWPRAAWRRRMAAPLLFVALFAVYVAFVLPWFRNQEVLPLLLSLCVGAGIPVAELLRRRARGLAGSTPRSLVVAALLALALGAGFFDSRRMLSCFSLRDTRAECQNFLVASFPRGGAMALEGYVSQVARGVPDAVCAPTGNFAERWPAGLDDEDLAPISTADPGVGRYLVRNALLKDRRGESLRESFSGRDRPETAAAKASFLRDVPLLRSWKLPEGRIRPSFAQPAVELRALPGGGAGGALRDVPLPFDRPALVLPRRSTLYDSSGASWFGPLQALPTSGRRTSLRMSRDGAPRWIVTAMPAPASGDAPVLIRRDGGAVPKSSRLAPLGAVASLWSPPRGLSAIAAEVFPEVRLRVKGDGGKGSCLTFVASDPAEAARALRKSGDPLGALALLRNGGGPTGETARVEAFLAAKASGLVPDEQWTTSARSALDAWDALLRVVGGDGPFPGSATACGVPLRALSDFSRIRLCGVPVGPGAAIGALLPPGEYSVRCFFRPDLAARISELSLFEGQTTPFARAATADGHVVLSTIVRQSGSGLLRFSSAAPDPYAGTPVVLPELEVSWDPVGLLSSAAAELRAALNR